MYRLIEEKEVTARKQHQCMCCLKPIEPGTVYHREKSVYDGFQDFKMHLPCKAFFDKWHAESGDEEFSEWELNEAWELANGEQEEPTHE